jgi:hypothetical protein
MTDQKPAIRALQQEWLVARIVGVFGAIFLIVMLGVLVASRWNAAPPGPVPPPAASGTAVSAQDAAARHAEDIALCTAALGAAQGLGLVPGFAASDGDGPRPAGAQGRYVCGAKTDAARYAVTFDIACTHLADAKCIVPIAIVQDGNQVLYQRR